MKLGCLFIPLCFLGIFSANAQIPAIGHWREHVNYSDGVAVAIAGDKVYHASNLGMFSYSLKDNEIEKIGKIQGLSDIGFGHLVYNTEAKALLIAYTNSNLDVIKNGKIYNLRDIRRSNIIGDKYIYGITQHKEFAYLATGFGIVVVDLKKLEINGTYIFGPDGETLKANSVAISPDSIYAATDEGIFQAHLRSANLADFNFWIKKTNLPNPEMPVKMLAYSENKLYILPTAQSFDQDSIYIYDAGTFKYFEKGNTYSIRQMQINDGLLYLTHPYGVIAYDANGKQRVNIYEYNSGIAPEPAALAIEKKDHFWISDKNQGLIAVLGGHFKIFAPNGPKTRNIYKLTANQDQVWIATGGKSNPWGNLYNYERISFFKDEKWNTVLPYLKETGGMIDILHIALNPYNANSKIYASSWGSGLGELSESGMIKTYNWRNSPLDPDPSEKDPKYQRTTVSSSAFDNNGNLWVANALTNSGLKVLKPDGKWKSFNIPGINQNTLLGDMIITSDNSKWVIIPEQSSILVFNENGTIDNTGDDRFIILTPEKGKGEIPGKNIFSMAEDKDGKVWIGTEAGVAVFYSPAAVFSDVNFDAQQILLTQDGNVQKLLENESVTAIAVDGANRKWFGTDGGGVFLMSADGTEQIHGFNSENSPLSSNTITSIAITQNGEVFFGTMSGLISYRGTASTGTDKHREVYAFPNPVRKDFEGQIAIKGLVQNAEIKITDLNGNLVFETRANGGQAVWDGYTLRGQKAATGVYMVFSSNNDGSETLVTKIMFVN